MGVFFLSNGIGAQLPQAPRPTTSSTHSSPAAAPKAPPAAAPGTTLAEKHRLALIDWIDYQSRDGDFQIKLPVKPTVDKDDSSELQLTAQFPPNHTPPGPFVVMINRTQCEDKPVPASELKRILSELPEGFKVTSKNLQTDHLLVTAVSHENQLKSTMTLRRRGSHAYLLLVIWPESSPELEKQAAACLASFRLKK